MSSNLISIVIPCFNESATIDLLHASVLETSKLLPGHRLEVIYVDDGSTDSTWNMLCDKITTPQIDVKAITLSRNFGQQLAICAGLSESRGEYVLVMDADLQDPPHHLVPMLEMAHQGFDVVYGQRKSRQHDSHFKRASAYIYYRLLRQVTEFQIPSDSGDFRLMHRRIVDLLINMPEPTPYLRGMVAWLGFSQTFYQFERQGRVAGVTHYSFKKMLNFALDGILGFSLAPLRLIFYMGILFFFISLVGIIYTIYAYISLSVVPGWSSVVTLILLMSGLQLLALGIIAEYLGKIFLQSKNRPKFIIREIKSASAEK